MDIGIRPIDNFNKVIADMTKHAFPTYTFRKQKRYMHRHLVKPRTMILYSIISSLHFHPETEGQGTAPLPADEIMDIIFHSMPIMWKNKMIAEGFNYADSTIKDMTDFFETMVEDSDPKEDKKKIFSSCHDIQG